MMNKDCAIARDLMPPVIDQVASEQSRAFVEDHVAACEPCAQVYANMQSKIQTVASDTETDSTLSFKTAMAQLRKTMGWRRLRTAILAVVLTVVLIVAGCGGYKFLLFRSVNFDLRALPMDAYKVSVYQGSNGSAYGTTTFLQYYRASSGPMLMREEDDTILYIYWAAPLILVKTDRPTMPTPQYGVSMKIMADGGLTLNGTTAIREIRQGKPDHYIVVYRAGDTIPPLDPVTDQFFQIQNKYFDQMYEVQQIQEDANKLQTDARSEYQEALDHLEAGETGAPTTE